MSQHSGKVLEAFTQEQKKASKLWRSLTGIGCEQLKTGRLGWVITPTGSMILIRWGVSSAPRGHLKTITIPDTACSPCCHLASDSKATMEQWLMLKPMCQRKETISFSYLSSVTYLLFSYLRLNLYSPACDMYWIQKCPFCKFDPFDSFLTKWAWSFGTFHPGCTSCQIQLLSC